ncbi:MAG: agmatine deiminase family protein, partial [Bacteroides sp.]|nr:agmatine deiminase family protein [Bacteroides sp.]
MGINVSYPLKTETKKDFQMPLPKSLTEVAEYATSYLPAEWHPQSGIQLTWPHAGTDWAYMLDEVEACFVNIARAIAARQLLLIVSPEPERVKLRLEKEGIGTTNIRFFTCETNDTWARDHGAITMMHNSRPFLLDFCFNGWGLKFASNHDNRITAQAVAKKVLHGEYVNSLDIVLEGGSIESDGQGTILTTSECLLSPNRNGRLSREEVEEALKQRLSAHRILWLDHGYLAGDDTDSHIDTLARFCDEHTIAYVACE